jgi:ubiquinone/menaquinone biosynthesis C-methylase UbiE
MGRRVLDVGCGRGGTVYVIHKFFAAKHITGIDLSSTAISFCKNTHRYAQVSFLEADAEALPFKDDSFEVVTNVESSHSYPNIDRFYSEVFHVLTANGYFLYTDVLPMEHMKQCVACLEGIGFILEREQDITANVLLSCDEIARTRLQAFGHQRNARFVEEFLSLPGSEVYADMKEGRSVYKIFKLRKAQGGSMWQTT